MKKYRSIIGFLILTFSCIVLLFRHYFIKTPITRDICSFCVMLLIVIGIIMIFPQVIFDNREWKENTDLPSLIKKIRLRALLYNNISVIIFVMIVLIIIVGSYTLIHPETDPKIKLDTADLITIRLSATALLIFLVQILFRAFKYLLRVAAFYNGKADAMEVSAISKDSDLPKLMDLFTPEKYDMSDVPTPSFLDKLGIK